MTEKNHNSNNQRYKFIENQLLKLEMIEDELSLSRITRWFGNQYVWGKNVLLNTVLLISIVYAIVALAFPDFIFQIDEVNSYIEERVSQELNQEMNRVNELVPINLQPLIKSNVSNLARNYYIKEAKEAIVCFIRYSSIPFVIISFMLLYIIRMNNKIKKRNQKISTAENLTNEVINDFKTFLKYEKLREDTNTAF